MRIYTPNIGKIKKIKKETKDIKTFQIKLENNLLKENFYFQPGEFALISVFGIGEAPFSFSSSPFNRKYFEISVRKVGNATNALFNLKEGDFVGVRGPYGKGYPMDEFEGKNIILISGGCGLAPLKSVVEYVLDKRNNYGKITLLYGVKTPNDILYKREMVYWKKKKDFKIYLTVDKGTKNWKGEIGVVTKLINKIKNFKNSVVCICGPPIMMKFTIQSLKEKKVEEENIFVSLERKMQCGLGLCCHCNINDIYVCKDGPVFRYCDIKNLSELGW
jgi:sulfite reductase subunit B